MVAPAIHLASQDAKFGPHEPVKGVGQSEVEHSLNYLSLRFRERFKHVVHHPLRRLWLTDTEFESRIIRALEISFHALETVVTPGRSSRPEPDSAERQAQVIDHD